MPLLRLPKRYRWLRFYGASAMALCFIGASIPMASLLWSFSMALCFGSSKRLLLSRNGEHKLARVQQLPGTESALHFLLNITAAWLRIFPPLLIIAMRLRTPPQTSHCNIAATFLKSLIILQGPLNWTPMLLRGTNPSKGCTPDRCRSSGRASLLWTVFRVENLA